MADVKPTELSNAQLKEQAAKILEARTKQRERMKSRSKQKREYVKQVLAIAEAKGLLPKTGEAPKA